VAFYGKEMSSRYSVCIHRIAKGVWHHLAKEKKYCMLKVHSEGEIFCFATACYYLILVGYGSLNKALINN
jgi:hypothetical protein